MFLTMCWFVGSIIIKILHSILEVQFVYKTTEQTIPIQIN